MWLPVHAELGQRGWDPLVVAHFGPAATTADVVTSAFAQALPATDDAVLVPHSNAGVFVPSVARQRRPRAVVYVDARLPESGEHQMYADAELRFHAGSADADGLLPRWCDWWENDIGPLFPSLESHRTCESQMRRLPLDYFADVIDGSGWASLPWRT